MLCPTKRTKEWTERIYSQTQPHTDTFISFSILDFEVIHERKTEM